MEAAAARLITPRHLPRDLQLLLQRLVQSVMDKNMRPQHILMLQPQLQDGCLRIIIQEANALIVIAWMTIITIPVPNVTDTVISDNSV